MSCSRRRWAHARAWLMKMLGRTGAQVQGACDGALRIPSSPPVRWLANADHHQGTSFACYAFPSFPHGLPRPCARLFPSPHPPANTTHILPPSKHTIAAASPAPVRVPPPSCAPPSLASLLPHSHLAPCPLPEPRSPSSRRFTRTSTPTYVSTSLRHPTPHALSTSRTRRVRIGTFLRQCLVNNRTIV